ncbi:HNH endonuclease [Clostridium sporogenes]|uniref:HNH endonuclease n=1 Tax=Clostridium sporogenes TaxID=1509 RepID=A0AAE6I646_CLOSG|nr:HNH endonuclease [Clostridium sporogenes]QDY32663.1 HNH endonuclease [Clostridium sporogenes]
MQKICTACGRILDISNFTKNRNLKDGYENKCKECRLKQRKKYINTCIACGNIFKTAYKSAEYCSAKCKPQCQNNKIKVQCDICGKEIKKTPSQIKRSKFNYCSAKCKHKGQSFVIQGENHPKYSQTEVRCDVCGKIFTRNISEIEKYKHNYCSNKCRYKGFSKHYSGENSPNYDHNKDEMDRIRNRNIEGYEEWRNNVFKKDDYTCQCCGDNKGGNLNAHHIFNYMEHKELRTNIENGITLCDNCHKAFHDIYGYKGNNKMQLKIFLNNYK